MEKSLENRMALFEIITRFSENRETLTDVSKLCEILLFENPYKSRIVLPTSREKLEIKVFYNPTYNFVGRSIHKQKEQLDKILINYKKEQYVDLSELLKILGHEDAHIQQENAIYSTQKYNYIPSKGTQAVLNSVQYAYDSNDAFDFLQYFQPNVVNEYFSNFDVDFDAVDAETCKYIKESLHGESVDKSSELYNDLKDEIDFYAYEQLKYEENAEDCGYAFAKEMLCAFHEDSLCPSHICTYLERCYDRLTVQYNSDMIHRNDLDYVYVKLLYQMALNNVRNLSVDDILKAPPKAQTHLSYAKLFQMREDHVPPTEYRDAVYKLGKYKELENHEFSYEYLKNFDKTK